MNGRPEPVSYCCEVLAEGVVCGTGQTAQYVLGTCQTISPVLALRWLQGKARHIADRLDPDPKHSAWVQPWMRADPDPLPDCPAGLRMWAGDAEEREAARDQLKEGILLSVVIPDNGCRYTLTVRPVTVPLPESSPHTARR